MPQELLTDYWSSYMQTYVERDVRRIADIKQLQTFGRFLRLLAALSGCEINYNELGRELSVNRTTAVAWTDIARATYQWHSLPAFSRNPFKRITGREKGYLADTGFLCYLLSINTPRAILTHPNHGRIFESFVVLEVLKTLQENGVRERTYHFRTYAGAEVDCVFDHDGYDISGTCSPKYGVFGTCPPNCMTMSRTLGPNSVTSGLKSLRPVRPRTG